MFVLQHGLKSSYFMRNIVGYAEHDLTTTSLLMADHEKRAFCSSDGVFCSRLHGGGDLYFA